MKKHKLRSWFFLHCQKHEHVMQRTPTKNCTSLLEHWTHETEHSCYVLVLPQRHTLNEWFFSRYVVYLERCNLKNHPSHQNASDYDAIRIPGWILVRRMVFENRSDSPEYIWWGCLLMNWYVIYEFPFTPGCIFKSRPGIEIPAVSDAFCVGRRNLNSRKHFKKTSISSYLFCRWLESRF